MFSSDQAKIQNQQYRCQIQEKIAAADDVYCMAADIANPDIPLRNDLELTQAGVAFFPKAALKMKQAPASGGGGKVKIVRFKNDSKPDRWFAIKRPRKELTNADTFGPYLRQYANNLKMSLKIGPHPNFMDVHAICIKKSGASNPKPYLVLSYCQGSLLSHLGEQSLANKINILSQIKGAMLHLYDCGINPHDLGVQNIMVSETNTVKLIDYDSWMEYKKNADLACLLYACIQGVALFLAGNADLRLPFIASKGLTSKSDLEDAMDMLIMKFQNHFDPGIWDRCTIM